MWQCTHSEKKIKKNNYNVHPTSVIKRIQAHQARISLWKGASDFCGAISIYLHEQI